MGSKFVVFYFAQVFQFEKFPRRFKVVTGSSSLRLLKLETSTPILLAYVLGSANFLKFYVLEAGCSLCVVYIKCNSLFVSEKDEAGKVSHSAICSSE